MALVNMRGVGSWAETPGAQEGWSSKDALWAWMLYDSGHGDAEGVVNGSEGAIPNVHRQVGWPQKACREEFLTFFEMFPSRSRRVVRVSSSPCLLDPGSIVPWIATAISVYSGSLLS